MCIRVEKTIQYITHVSKGNTLTQATANDDGAFTVPCDRMKTDT